LGKIGPFNSASLLFLTEKEREEESVVATGRCGWQAWPTCCAKEPRDTLSARKETGQRQLLNSCFKQQAQPYTV